MPCSDVEIDSLKTVLVESNERVVGIKITRGYMGCGGTNLSDFSAESTRVYTADELNGSEPIAVNKTEICALINDVLYFRCHNGDGTTLDLKEKERTYRGESMAYDTVSATKVELLLKDDCN